MPRYRIPVMFEVREYARGFVYINADTEAEAQAKADDYDSTEIDWSSGALESATPDLDSLEYDEIEEVEVYEPAEPVRF